ncbi:hypothetical protein G4G28_06410 [Massilia sp. Dwa41.01b]|uniref:hypothetical protein n=1 Tax=Massilia sp. Dwa41.01b TaxID=2709302 RepID=UPI0015FFB429|nr:hypothetical protein [Massilia sp. Dwa41.01b]QNA88223.1 hypothetical protein G4G28_06410 [Massilia sp. Dwa41.01b]
MNSIPSIVPLLPPSSPSLQVGAVPALSPVGSAVFAATAEAELPLPQSVPVPSAAGVPLQADGAAMRPDQVFMSRQLSFTQDGRTLAGAWRSMVGNYGASLVDRELRARAALPPAALVLAQDGRVPGRALEGHVLPADPWRFTVHAGSARDQHLQVLRQPADGSSGRRKRPRAALRLELELADGTQVALQVEPVPGGVAIEMAAPGAVALARLRAIQPALEAAVERAGLVVVRWSFVDAVLPPGSAHAVVAADAAADVLTLPVFRAVAEMALVLPAQG